LGRDTKLHTSPDDVQILYPETAVIGPYALTLPGQLERVSAVAFNGNVEDEIAQFMGGKRRIGSTRQLSFHDVLVVNGTLHSDGRRWVFNDQAVVAKDKIWTEQDYAVCRSSFLGCHYFGHWLRDDCATDILASEMGAPVSMPTPRWPDRNQYLSLFGQRQVDLNHAFVRNLILYDDVSQNEHKALRLRKLRERLRDSVLATPTDVVYLKRGASGVSRQLVNERELIELLKKMSVRIVEPESIQTSRVIEELIDARLIISIEGSQISHALFCLRNQGALLVLQPPDRFYNPHMDWARALGMKYGALVGHPAGGGFFIPPKDLLRGIEMMQNAT
jgi:capsular polysaccharide biosynthesis protein